MRIGFDLSVVRHGLTNGSAVYAYRLAEALLRLEGAPKMVVYFGARRSDASDAALAALDRLGADIAIGPAPWRWSPDAGWWLPPPPIQKLMRSVDVFHSGELLIPPATSTACVGTVYDLTTHLFPEQHTRWNRWLHARRLRWIRDRADRVLVCSANTGRDLERLYGISAERIDLIYGAQGHRPAVAAEPTEPAEATLERLAIGTAPYVLAVGTLEPRKNHERLIRAFAGLRERHPDLLLVLVGGCGWRSEPIRNALDEPDVRERVRLLGLLPEDTLRTLYARASVFAFPSLYEGFGLPVLEAMAAGVPVLTSNLSSLPEVAGDAAVLVDPRSVEEIRDGLSSLIRDPQLREQLACRGSERAQMFTWRRTAELALQCYARAMGSHPAERLVPGELP